MAASSTRFNGEYTDGAKSSRPSGNDRTNVVLDDPIRLDPSSFQLSNNDYPESGSVMSNSRQLAHQWWATLNQVDRQRVWDSRHRYLAGDLVESMAKAGVPVVSDGRWSCVSVGPTGFTVPIAVQQLLEGLSRVPNGDRPPGNA
jgi:hypothetical protein